MFFETIWGLLENSEVIEGYRLGWSIVVGNYIEMFPDMSANFRHSIKVIGFIIMLQE